MSASICWAPVLPTKAETITTMAPSKFMEQVKDIFGEFPVELGSAEDIRTLQTIIVVDSSKTWKQLLELLLKHERIKLWAEY